MPSFSNAISILTAFVVTSSITTTVGSTNDFNPRRLASKNSKKNATPQSRCNAQLFEGMWMYKNCNDVTVAVTMGCTNNNKGTCSYRENNFADEGNSCPVSGTFHDEKTSSSVSYNFSNGRCEIEYFPFTEDPCGLYPQLGMKAYIDMNEDGGGGQPGIMYLLFSDNVGETFYNEGNKRVATRMSSDEHRELRWEGPHPIIPVMDEVPECTKECKEEKDGQKKAGRECCAKEKQFGKCLLNSEGNTCNCHNKIPCYIYMRCVDDQT